MGRFFPNAGGGSSGGGGSRNDDLVALTVDDTLTSDVHGFYFSKVVIPANQFADLAGLVSIQITTTLTFPANVAITTFLDLFNTTTGWAAANRDTLAHINNGVGITSGDFTAQITMYYVAAGPAIVLNGTYALQKLGLSTVNDSLGFGGGVLTVPGNIDITKEITFRFGGVQTINTATSAGVNFNNAWGV